MLENIHWTQERKVLHLCELLCHRRKGAYICVYIETETCNRTTLLDLDSRQYCRPQFTVNNPCSPQAIVKPLRILAILSSVERLSSLMLKKKMYYYCMSFVGRLSLSQRVLIGRSTFSGSASSELTCLLGTTFLNGVVILCCSG